MRASFHLPATLHEYHFRPNPVRVKVCEMQRANDEAQVMFTVQKRRLLLQGVPEGPLEGTQERMQAKENAPLHVLALVPPTNRPVGCRAPPRLQTGLLRWALRATTAAVAVGVGEAQG